MFQCPACYVEDFHKTKLIEHNTCGNISLKFEYVDDFCPDCNEKIKLGIDYKIINNMYVFFMFGEIFQTITKYPMQ